MDAQDLEQKIVALMLKLGSMDALAAKSDLDALRRKVDEMGVTLSDEMTEAFDALGQMIDMMADPAGLDLETVARACPEEMSLTLEPEPEIFDAIQEGDAAGVTAALKTWDVNAQHGQFAKTALYEAVSGFGDCSLEIATLLLDAGADPRKGLGKTNVLHGLGFGRWQGEDLQALATFVQRCVALGADIEERSDNLQWTPLMTALNEWEAVAVEALLVAGADPNAKAGVANEACTAGQSCLEMALCEPTLIELLLQYGASPALCQVEARLRAWRDRDNGEFVSDLVKCQTLIDRRRLPS